MSQTWSGLTSGGVAPTIVEKKLLLRMEFDERLIAIATAPCDGILDRIGLNGALTARQSQRAENDPANAVNQDLSCDQTLGRRVMMRARCVSELALENWTER